MALKPTSLAGQIAALESGKTLCKTEMMGLSRPGLDDEIKAAKRRLRNHLNKHAERASQATGNAYRLDTGLWVSSEDAAVFVSVAITRIM